MKFKIGDIVRFKNMNKNTYYPLKDKMIGKIYSGPHKNTDWLQGEDLYFYVVKIGEVTHSIWESNLELLKKYDWNEEKL